VIERRTLFGSSGRSQAWAGALDQGLERPFAGYGFGTESRAFADRYFQFQGEYPENSYLGIFLQLGVAGLLALLAAFLVPLALLVRVASRLAPEDRRAAFACAAIVVAGLVLALGQSYLYSVGNVATVTVWVALLLLSALVARDAGSG
jgi:O-antigen ligase